VVEISFLFRAIEKDRAAVRVLREAVQQAWLRKSIY
jgi:hypothetical protein